MTRRTGPGRAKKAAPSPFPEVGLAELGLAPGDTVRFRRRESERWKQAVVSRRERDGSIGLHDGRGASRSIPIELIEVQAQGPRGGLVWEPLAARAARTEQIPLVRAKPVKRHIPLPDASTSHEPDDPDPADDVEQLRLL